MFYKNDSVIGILENGEYIVHQMWNYSTKVTDILGPLDEYG
jgi:hypothetical protein